jgi:hypothetical protein
MVLYILDILLYVDLYFWIFKDLHLCCFYFKLEFYGFIWLEEEIAK